MAESLEDAAGKLAPFVLVRADPLGELGAEWAAMWDEPGRTTGSRFEERAGEVLLGWRAGRFDLPDYYLVVAGPGPHPHEFHLSVLHAARPAQVAAVATADTPAETAGRLIHALRGLGQGPWWPPVDELVESARHFFPATVT